MRHIGLIPSALLITTAIAAQAVAEPQGIPVAGALSAPAASARADQDDRIVCEFTIVTGSHIKERVCRTTAEWTRIERENEDQIAHASFPREDCKLLTQGVFRCDPK